MKYVWILCIGIALLGWASFCGAVEYDARQPINLQVRASAYKVAPGQTVNISIAAYDVYYSKGPNNTTNGQVSDQVTFNYSAAGGQLQQTGGNGNVLYLRWTSPMAPGYYAIYVKGHDSGRYGMKPVAAQIIQLAVEQAGAAASAPSVRVGANPQTVLLNRANSTLITAQLFGGNVAGKTVYFYTTGGSLSANSAFTDVNGATSVRLSVGDGNLGAVQVAASYGNTTATTTVEVVRNNPAAQPYPQPAALPLPPPSSQGVLIAVQPSTLPADGQSTAVVTVRATDPLGNGYPQQPVIFRSSIGVIQPASVTDQFGYARVQLTAPNNPGTALINAQIGALQGYAAVIFVGAVQPQQPDAVTAPPPDITQPPAPDAAPTPPPDAAQPQMADTAPLEPNAAQLQTVDTAPLQPAVAPPHVYLTVDPTTLPADGNTTARVEALVLDGSGHALVGVPISFSTTLGKLPREVVTTGQDGRAAELLTAADHPGLATVSAQTPGTLAASQVTFTGTGADAKSPTLEIHGWGGQQSSFIAEKWLLRDLQLEDGTTASVSHTVQILDDNAKVSKEFELGGNGILITDQHGLACGYTNEEADKLQVHLLHPDGSLLRALTVNLPLGSHAVFARYANPAGNLLLGIAYPDGSKPILQFFSAQNDPLLLLHDGLETLPVTALGADGCLVVALPGGTVRLYNPAGVLVSEAKRTDGLPTTQAAVGPGGEWYAVAAAPVGQTTQHPCLIIFSQQGTPLAVFNVEVTALDPCGNNALVASTPEQTVYVNLVSKRIAWSLPGGYDHFLSSGNYGVIAGQHDPQTKQLVSRVLIVNLQDGTPVNTQDFGDLHAITALLPPNDKGLVGVVTTAFSIRFPLPAK